MINEVKEGNQKFQWQFSLLSVEIFQLEGWDIPR